MKKNKRHFIDIGLLLLTLFLFESMCISLQRANQYFEANKEYGKAEIIEEKIDATSKEDYLKVKVLDVGDDKVYTCYCGDIFSHNYSIGSIVDVVYERRTMRVELVDNPPHNYSGLWKICSVVGGIILIVDIIKSLAKIFKNIRKDSNMKQI